MPVERSFNQTKLVIPDPILLWECSLSLDNMVATRGAEQSCQRCWDPDLVSIRPPAPGHPPLVFQDWGWTHCWREEGRPSQPGPGAMLVLARRGAFPIIKIRIVAWTWAQAYHWPHNNPTQQTRDISKHEGSLLSFKRQFLWQCVFFLGVVISFIV